MQIAENQEPKLHAKIKFVNLCGGASLFVIL